MSPAMTPPGLRGPLDLFEADDLLQTSITYKPGWHLQLTAQPEPAIEITVVTKDSANRSADLTIIHRIAVEKGRLQDGASVWADRNDFLAWLRVALQQVEEHELEEWLQVDGWAPFHPHRDGRP